jgi:hypothetical protein
MCKRGVWVSAFVLISCTASCSHGETDEHYSEILQNKPENVRKAKEMEYLILSEKEKNQIE